VHILSLMKEHMPRSKSFDYRLLLKVSKLYYEQGYTQQQISNRLNLSRPKVSRLLQQAKDVGIVKINIIPQPGVYTDLEDALETKFGLKEVVVVGVSEPNSQMAVSKEVGAAAADYFLRTTNDPCIIGIAWGTSLRAMVDAMPVMDCHGSHVVQLIGGLGNPESEAHATYILRRLVAQTESKLSVLPVPWIVDSADVKKVFLSDSHVQERFERFPKISVAYVGIGTPTPDSVVMRDGSIISQKELDFLKSEGVVGDICLRFFDKDGQIVLSDVDERVMGISLEELSAIDRVVGVTGGPNKYRAIQAALQGKLINVLITDNESAKKVLES